MGSSRARTPQKEKECLRNILNGTGYGFEMGLLGGSAFHFLKGLYASPNGARLAGACQAVRLNAPRVGGKFAAWFALSFAFSGALCSARQKDDSWNRIAGPAVASGLLSVRHGLGASARFAVLGGGICALSEFSYIFATKFEANFEDKRARINS